MRNVAVRSGTENENTILRSVIFFFENHGVYEIMFKNIVEQHGACALHAGYLVLPTHTHNM
jgi:hypothetical protein